MTFIFVFGASAVDKLSEKSLYIIQPKELFFRSSSEISFSAIWFSKYKYLEKLIRSLTQYIIRENLQNSLIKALSNIKNISKMFFLY